jgi:hypothetical protein
MLHGYQHTVPLSEVADMIWCGNAIVGSDGSAANDHGTYSFVILIDTHTDSPPDGHLMQWQSSNPR